MAAQITPFEFESRPTRVIIIDSDPWFVASDVCKAPGIKNSRDASGKLDADEKGVALADTLGGQQELATINESGLYTLILLSRNATKLAPNTVSANGSLPRCYPPSQWLSYAGRTD